MMSASPLERTLAMSREIDFLVDDSVLVHPHHLSPS
jgi:hypothetical protein